MADTFTFHIRHTVRMRSGASPEINESENSQMVSLVKLAYPDANLCQTMQEIQ